VSHVLYLINKFFPDEAILLLCINEVLKVAAKVTTRVFAPVKTISIVVSAVCQLKFALLPTSGTTAYNKYRFHCAQRSNLSKQLYSQAVTTVDEHIYA
jgi:hypothetical protein